MKLLEMFPAQEEPNENAEIDWVDDLKFYIDNDHHMMATYLFPAIKRHEQHIDHPKAYKIYLKPILSCYKHYCDKFNIKDPQEKFDKESLIKLAKHIAEEQKKHIEDGDYGNQGKKHKVSESTLSENVSEQSAIRSIVATGESIKKVFIDLKAMAKKWVEDRGELKGFHFIAGGRGKRWYDTFYWNKMETDLQTLLQKNPRAAAPLKEFFDLPKDEKGHISFIKMSRSLPELLVEVGKNLENQDLKRFGRSWYENNQDFEEYLDRVESEVNAGDNVIPADEKKSRDNILGQQSAAAEDLVSQVLNSLDRRVAGEIRNAIARSPNKILALQKELAKRNIKIGESLEENWKKTLATLGLAGALGFGSVAGAQPPADPVQNKIVATLTIGGETKVLDLSPKNFKDVKEATKWLEQFLDERGISNWSGKIERGVQGSGNYQRMRISDVDTGPGAQNRN